ncbi:hypothetical protein [Butyrivibrio sp. FC2001]|uniref:hypothetical protein n=1 Tax=Butyrivibrio sp. FC2001 TaxID=1280671 RepID=UPI00042126E8|nr:hypothetical protein [Butyrivibrio sp. FC2001]
MKNVLKIDKPIIGENKIICNYSVEGDWEEVFHKDEQFFLEYNVDISKVPESVAIIPFLANVLPIAWVCDAKIIVPSLDKDFYDSIPEFKKGYQDMFPMIDFKGNLEVGDIVSNEIEDQDGAISFFSGGVDAFNTLTCHLDEKPALITLWGADVKLDDVDGWKKVESHIEETGREFGLDHIIVKSSFRTFLDEWKMSQKVLSSGDNWWHGFQHGLGIISHAAPVMFALGKKHIYFASSFTAADKGKYKCASDPTIDNHIRFCGADVIHDGYEFSRQNKVHNITQFAKRSGNKLSLRVCWESKGGSNCCDCEKCWRTILAIYAEGFDPREFGFEYDDFGKLLRRMHMYRDKMRQNSRSRYNPIQEALHKNYTLDSVNKDLRWFYNADIDHISDFSIPQRIKRKIQQKLFGC